MRAKNICGSTKFHRSKNTCRLYETLVSYVIVPTNILSRWDRKRATKKLRTIQNTSRIHSNRPYSKLNGIHKLVTDEMSVAKNLSVRLVLSAVGCCDMTKSVLLKSLYI